MKKSIKGIALAMSMLMCSSFGVSVSAASEIAINSTNFPDEVFRKYVSRFDKDSSGGLSESEIAERTSFDLSDKGVASLKGIEHFTALEKLYCDYNELTSLDVSKNTALKILSCYDNQLTSLNISKNTALIRLVCSENQLTNLDVSNNTALTWLNCDSNQLTSFDVSKNTALTHLECYENQLKSLDVSKNTALDYLYCKDNQLTSLDVSKNTALKYLYCDKNQLTSLDVSKNTALTHLDCNENRLKSLDVSKNTALIQLVCYENQLTSLDVSKNTALKQLYCDENQLTSLDVSKNTDLTELLCNENQLTSLDVSKNTALIHLVCYGNQLTSLDVSKNTALKQLHCGETQLTSLDVSKNTALKHLYCDENQLTSLDISKNTALEDLYCDENQLTSLDVSKNTALEYLICDYNQLTNLDVSKNTALDYLECSHNQLTSLDVSKNTALEDLWCSDNQLTSLDVSKNTALIHLVCSENQLTSLDVSKHTLLKKLECKDNKFNIGNVSSYPLSNLPTGFDPSKASDWQGATYDSATNTLKDFTSKTITYDYNCGNDKTATFTLVVGGTSGTTPEITDPVESFVNRLYTILLGRNAEPDGLADWTNRLKSGTATSAEIVSGIACSQEFANFGLSNEEIVERMYLAMLDRPSDAAGKASWVNGLNSGMTVNGIVNGFSGSQEFGQICAEYGIQAGSVSSLEARDKSAGLTSFIARMYTKALGRSYDVAGLNDWTGRYLTGQEDIGKIAYGFIFSPEFVNKGLSDSDYVDTLYRTFFDREPDEGGKADWMSKLAGGMSREDVLSGFVGSQECANLVASFGIG